MEQVLPPQTLEGSGFEFTRIRQFTIFLENKVGRLQMLVRAMEEGAGHIVALSIEESGDMALVRIVAAHPDFARELLRTGNFPFAESELLAVELPKKSKHPLITICSTLLAAEINIHYAYPLFSSKSRGPAMAMFVDDLTLAAQLFIKKGFRILGESDLA
jgi:hypothetical protein